MLDRLTDTRSSDIVVAAAAASSNRPRFEALSGLAARCAELGIAAPTPQQLAAIRRKARAEDVSEDDALDAWMAKAQRRAANRAAEQARTARKTRLTARSERMARALAARSTAPKKRRAAVARTEETEPRRELHYRDVENPFFQKEHQGAAGNPETIIVAVNFGESPLVRLSESGVLQAAEAQAGLRFRDLYERAGKRSPSPGDVKERVDGGSAPDAFNDGRMAAGFELRSAYLAVGERNYGIVRFVAGEGHSLRELSKKIKSSRRTARKVLRAALDALVQHWGLSNGPARDLDEDDGRAKH
ncbi:DUF6456 domain-containing protein [Antarcticirhabdus aurantiaca]|uniref:DUF6456 domain-containing protein n=1 Tax=Antarcticirhabdus aurantiaca TaxID=2606717 RepID=UPI00131DE4D2|nr:DUF6456 domain-containing protein [Antarcticirhabdus aurantiaca]